jgi:hypothetical protein
MGRLAKYAISVITTIVTLIAFISFLTSTPMKTWTKTHSEVIFYAAIFLFLTTGASLNYLFEEKKGYRRLKDVTARAKPSEHDKKLFQGLLAMLPPDGPVIEWLKENFMAKAFFSEHYNVIESILRSMRLRPLEFDNPHIEASYDQLHRGIQAFEDTTLQYMWQEPDDPWMRIPPEWDDERFEKARNDILEVRRELVEKYDSFLELAHKNNID